jgi:hypothetical protein
MTMVATARSHLESISSHFFTWSRRSILTENGQTEKGVISNKIASRQNTNQPAALLKKGFREAAKQRF